MLLGSGIHWLICVTLGKLHNLPETDFFTSTMGGRELRRMHEATHILWTVR